MKLFFTLFFFCKISEFVYHILNSEVADDEARSFLVKMEPKFEPKMEPKLEQI